MFGNFVPLDHSICRFDEMTKPETKLLEAPCGVMMSPRLPGDVMPGVWTWIIAPPSDHYFIVSVAYVRGPGLLGKCNTFFRCKFSIKFVMNQKIYDRRSGRN